MAGLNRLVDYFAEELHQHIDDPDARTQLDELLRIRPAAPIPIDIVGLLHTLLTEEASARNVVELDDLPVLHTDYAGLGPLGSVRLWQGDITTVRADAIVNSANPGMLGCFTPWHQCIDHAIHRGAGPGLRAECATIMRSTRVEQPGRVKATAAYHLPCRHVMHTVRPPVGGPDAAADDLELLASCYRNCLNAALLVADRSVVLPTLGTSPGGFSPAESAQVALEVVDTWLATNSGVAVVLNTFDDDITAAYEHAVSLRASATR